MNMAVQKTSLNKFKIEIISSVFSDHNSMRLTLNYKKKKKSEKHKHTESKEHVNNGSHKKSKR